MSEPWTDSELEAAVDAYLEMLTKEETGQSYTKADVNAALRAGPLQTRSKKSVEFRMSNISAVLAELGHDWIPGYQPLTHVGSAVSGRIRQMLERRGVVGA